jgi:hypothetical protein
MNFVRYPRAAVAIGGTGKPANNPPGKDHPLHAAAPLVLWASVAQPVRDGGRLVGVRRHSSFEVEVAWIGPGRTVIQWMPAHLMLTDYEVQRWKKVARFSRP